MELEEGNPDFKPVIDRRVRLADPLPVRLTAVDDVRLPASADVEDALDKLYCNLLQFERVEGELTYRADNFYLRFEAQDRPVEHDSLRPQGIEVQSLAETRKKLIDAEIDYIRQRGVMPGQESLLIVDPAGNWIEISEFRRII